MSANFLHYGRQQIEDDDIAAVANVMRGDFLTTGPTAEAFECAFAHRVEAGGASVCSSGTAALHMALLALGVGKNDIVIVPTVTFLATANAARFVGAEVVFADVDPESGLVGPEQMEDAIALAKRSHPGLRLRAMIPVHLNGHTCAMADLQRIAQRHDMYVVEDACHALGTRVAMDNLEIPVGSCRWSDMACFSFHPVKTIAMGEGGATTSNNPALLERLGRLRNHGMSRNAETWTETDQAFTLGEPNPWYYEMPELGFNYRASDIHCALGLSQLKKLDLFIERRRALADHYREMLEPLAAYVNPILTPPGCQPCLHLFVVKIDFDTFGHKRALVMNELKRRGIGTQVHYIPVHRQPYYRARYGQINLPGADAYYQRALSLPMFPAMTFGDVARVTNNLAEVLQLPA